MGTARGVRLSKQRVREIGWFESDAGAALACLQAQRYEPSSGGTDPSRLLVQERFVQRASRVTERVARISEVRQVLTEGPADADATVHWARVARVCHALWKKVKGEAISDLDKAFGVDLVPLLGETPSVKARALIAWPKWVCGERPWITESSRPVTEMVLRFYEGDKQAAREAFPDWSTSTFQADRARMAHERCGERLAMFEASGQWLDQVAWDVLDRAVAEKTFDDELVTTARNEADALLSTSSIAVQNAWNAIDGRRAAAEERELKGDVAATENRMQRLIRLRERLGPAPKTNRQRVRRAAEIIEEMRTADRAEGT